MVSVHHWLRTWCEQVDIYVVLSEFARRKFVEGGIPPEKIVVKPNFVHPDPGVRNGNAGYALFVGRLSPEKGIGTLLRAWQCLSRVPLKIVGDGPLMHEVQGCIYTQKIKGVEVLGQRTQEEVISMIKGARFLVFPSECYETFGRVIVEAFACGVPVVASRLGAIAEVVEDGRTGLLFAPGDATDLASKIHSLFEYREKGEEMGRNARNEYETKYTHELNYEMLLGIYERAIENSKLGH
jgi:glycosyltransferase involved in cell wall biosynthesis